VEESFRAFSAVRKAARITESYRINDRLNAAYATLLSRSLTYVDDNARAITRVSIVKQLWYLVLDELRTADGV